PTAVHVGAADLPFVDIGGGNLLKVIQVKEREGLWIVENVFMNGFEVPTHRHTGPVWGYTVSGAWKYKEYDYVNRAGSFLYEPALYVAGPPHEIFSELRRTRPVYFQSMADEPGYWMVLKHADVVHVAREPTLFSAGEGGVMLENLAPDQLDMMRNMLLAMDPPRHVDYRRPVAPRFKARVIASMEGQIRGICREIMAAAAAKRDVEFVHDVTSSLPSRVIGELMGLPAADLPMIHR